MVAVGTPILAAGIAGRSLLRYKKSRGLLAS